MTSSTEEEVREEMGLKKTPSRRAQDPAPNRPAEMSRDEMEVRQAMGLLKKDHRGSQVDPEDIEAERRISAVRADYERRFTPGVALEKELRSKRCLI